MASQLLYKLDELTEGGAFLAEYNKAIAEGKSHELAVALAGSVVEDLTKDKVLAYAIVYKNLMAEVKALDDEMASLEARAKAAKNKAEALKSRLQERLEKGFELKDPKAVVKFKKCPPSAMVINPDLVPEIYKRKVPETSEPNKEKILENLKLKEEIPGCVLIDDKHNISIK